MLYGSSDDGSPAFAMGITVGKIVVVLAWFILSLVGVWYAGNFFVAYHGIDTSGTIYLAPNIAGLYSVLSLVLSFSTVFAGLGIIVAAISVMRTGRVELFDDHVIWKIRGKTQRKEYSDLKDAYFGYQVTSSTSSFAMAYSNNPSNQQFSYSRVVSFYIDNTKFTFSTKKRPGLTKFLETRIPKSNIDVEDDDDQ